MVFFVQQHILPGNGAQVGVKGLLVYTKPKQKHLAEPLSEFAFLESRFVRASSWSVLCHSSRNVEVN